jgi:hypothetical protein
MSSSSSSSSSTSTASESKTEYNCIAAYEVKGQLKPFSYQPFSLRPNDVEIAIHACGG